MIKKPKKNWYDRLKNYERKIKWPFLIYTSFQILFVPEDNGN